MLLQLLLVLTHIMYYERRPLAGEVTPLWYDTGGVGLR